MFALIRIIYGADWLNWLICGLSVVLIDLKVLNEFRLIGVWLSGLVFFVGVVFLLLLWGERGSWR
jgi:hypothetical protein